MKKKQLWKEKIKSNIDKMLKEEISTTYEEKYNEFGE